MFSIFQHNTPWQRKHTVQTAWGTRYLQVRPSQGCSDMAWQTARRAGQWRETDLNGKGIDSKRVWITTISRLCTPGLKYHQQREQVITQDYMILLSRRQTMMLTQAFEGIRSDQSDCAVCWIIIDLIVRPETKRISWLLTNKPCWSTLELRELWIAL